MTVCALMRPSKSSTSALMLNPPTNIALRICTIPGVLLQEFWGRIWSFRRSWLMLWASFGSWMAVYWRSAFLSSTSSSCVWSRSAWCETFLHHFPTKFIYSFDTIFLLQLVMSLCWFALPYYIVLLPGCMLKLFIIELFWWMSGVINKLRCIETHWCLGTMYDSIFILFWRDGAICKT